MSDVQEFDSVTGSLFFVAGLIGVLGAWRYSLRRARDYSRHYAGHRAVRFPLSSQLTLGVFEGKRVWLYSHSW